MERGVHAHAFALVRVSGGIFGYRMPVANVSWSDGAVSTVRGT